MISGIVIVIRRGFRSPRGALVPRPAGGIPLAMLIADRNGGASKSSSIHLAAVGSQAKIKEIVMTMHARHRSMISPHAVPPVGLRFRSGMEWAFQGLARNEVSQDPTRLIRKLTHLYADRA